MNLANSTVTVQFSLEGRGPSRAVRTLHLVWRRSQLLIVQKGCRCPTSPIRVLHCVGTGELQVAAPSGDEEVC